MRRGQGEGLNARHGPITAFARSSVLTTKLQEGGWTRQTTVRELGTSVAPPPRACFSQSMAGDVIFPAALCFGAWQEIPSSFLHLSIIVGLATEEVKCVASSKANATEAKVSFSQWTSGEVSRVSLPAPGVSSCPNTLFAAIVTKRFLPESKSSRCAEPQAFRAPGEPMLRAR